VDEIKLRFALTEAQSAGFPVAFESLWFRREVQGFRLLNSPFFIDGISFDDVISVRTVDADTVEVESVVHPSQNSTIWVNVAQGLNGRPIVDELRKLGCGVEGGVFDGYYSVNVPGGVDIEPVYAMLDSLVDEGQIEINYPSIRHS